jgi:mannose-1-phosphate guanylyltransferase
MVATVGLQDTIIIDTPDALLVANKNRAQEVKDIYQQLKAADHETHKLHQTVYRPWGTYTVLEEGPNFKIKRIVVNPNESLSLQMHHHRSEHWVVVNGTAEVQNGDDKLILQKNESTFIPCKNKHRLQNRSQTPLIIIEVQTGDYLGEDDIVRFDDVYGREKAIV